ncbi:hypothetical protein ISCGN_003474 [Ixodes scapularis]
MCCIQQHRFSALYGSDRIVVPASWTCLLDLPPGPTSGTCLRDLPLEPASGTCLRDLPLGPASGTCLWDLPLGPASGTCLRDLPLGPASGTCLWDLPLGPASGTCFWDLPPGPASGTCLRDLPLGPASRTCFRDLPLGPASGTCLRDLPPGPASGTCLRDLPLGPVSGTCLWDLPLGPASGTCLWDLPPGPASGTCLRDLPLGPASGTCLRDLPPGPASGTCLWDLPPGPASGTCLWDLPLGPASGTCLRDLPPGSIWSTRSWMGDPPHHGRAFSLPCRPCRSKEWHTDSDATHCGASWQKPNCRTAAVREGDTLGISFPTPHMFRCTEEGCSSAYSAAAWTSRRQSLQRHLEGDHGVRIRRTTNHCALCSVTLGARPSAHPCLANGNHTAAPTQQRHQCPECPASFPSRKGLGNHRQWHRKQRAGRQALVDLGVSASHGDTTSGVSHGRPATVASCRPAGPCETVRRTPSSASRTRASYASTPAPVGSTVEPPDMQLTPMALPSPNPQLPPEAEFTFAPLLCPRDRVCRSPGDDTVLSDKLQLDSALTLEIAVAAARNSEAVKQQHKEMRGQGRSNWNARELQRLVEQFDLRDVWCELHGPAFAATWSRAASSSRLDSAYFPAALAPYVLRCEVLSFPPAPFDNRPASDPEVLRYLRMTRSGGDMPCHIPSVTLADGTKSSLPEDIERVFCEHFSALSESHRDPLDGYFNSRVFSFCGALPQVPEPERDSLARPITLLEASEALRCMKSGSSPGTDGLPTEFYREFWPQIGTTLVAVFNAFLRGGGVPDSFRRGRIVLLPKEGGDHSTPNAWRPITHGLQDPGRRPRPASP